MRSPAQAPARGPGFEVTGSRHFLEWLDGLGASLVASTYHSNRLFLFGVKPDGRMSIFQRMYERAMGLAAHPERLYLATRYQLWQFDNILRPGESEGNYDRFYKPHRSWTTGDVDIHDIAFGADGSPIFVEKVLEIASETIKSVVDQSDEVEKASLSRASVKTLVGVGDVIKILVQALGGDVGDDEVGKSEIRGVLSDLMDTVGELAKRVVALEQSESRESNQPEAVSKAVPQSNAQPHDSVEVKKPNANPSGYVPPRDFAPSDN